MLVWLDVRLCVVALSVVGVLACVRFGLSVCRVWVWLSLTVGVVRERVSVCRYVGVYDCLAAVYVAGAVDVDGLCCRFGC